MDWKNLITFALLIINSWRDLRSREICFIPTVIYGLAGILYKFFTAGHSLYNLIPDLIPGLFLLLIGKISREKVGYGDGLVILTTGIWIGFTDCLLTLTTGLFMAFIFSAVLLALKKFKRDTELPFIPFLLFSYLGRMFLS